MIGILAAIAIPNYQRYVTESRRTDAKSALMQTAGQLERCYTVTSDYRIRSVSASGATKTYTTCIGNSEKTSLSASESTTIESPENYYSVTANASSASYSITASPSAGSPQNDDTACPSFTLDQTGKKGPDDKVDECW
ncbi:type IV pilin protein [Halomonas lysinitropha]|uniref:type IV pilin protein n=1 Tax=Halomonas lysinitropha TaxID=2607506 RepID=UPI003898F047